MIARRSLRSMTTAAESGAVLITERQSVCTAAWNTSPFRLGSTAVKEEFGPNVSVS